jgi:hypothetical protein
MNSSISSADATTHLRIVVTALMTAIVVVWTGLAARSSYDANAAKIAMPATFIQSSAVTN